MRSLWSFALVATVVLSTSAWADPAAVLPQRVLYLGTADTTRTREYAAFLGARFARVQTANRDAGVPADAAQADVVILDWSQGDAQRAGRFEFPYPERDLKSPLGSRDAWVKPTVLIGSAGHLLAACWQVHGGSG
jgi:hypothetical protein